MLNEEKLRHGVEREMNLEERRRRSSAKEISSPSSPRRQPGGRRLVASLQAPIGDFNATGEPNFRKSLRVADEFLDNFCSEWNTGNKWMTIEREEFRRALLPFPIQVVELVFHDLQ